MGEICSQRFSMKNNYIFNSIDLTDIPKVSYLSKQKSKVSCKKKERKKREYLNRIPKKYAIYIKSKHWEKRKNQYYKIHRKICQACNSKTYIDLHHLLYGNFGNEKDEHLTALCRECHEEYHTIYGVKGNMIDDTNKFIIEKREQVEFPKI